MTLSLTANLVTGLLCVAVLVQSLRMMRGLARMERLGLSETVSAMDRATSAARQLLGDLKISLADEGQRLAATRDEASKLRDELATLVSLADARASRIAELTHQPPPTILPAQPARASGHDILQRWKRAAQSTQSTPVSNTPGPNGRLQ